MNTTTESRKVGRPRKNESRADTKARPKTRVPVHGSRDILTILQGKDPDYVYRFVKDVAENGSRILRFTQAGYQFVRSDAEGLVVGQNHVYKSQNDGSIIAVKEGAGYLYLMKIQRDWYDEDQTAKQGEIKATEDMIKRRRNEETDDGMYGEPKISSKTFLP